MNIMSTDRTQDGFLRGTVGFVQMNSFEFSPRAGRFIEKPLLIQVAYREDGSKTQEIHHFRNSNRAVRIALIFGSHGKLIERREHIGDVLVNQRIFCYDSAARLVEEMFSTIDGAIRMRAISTYDDVGGRSETIREGAEQMGKDFRIYDGTGRLVRSGTYGGGGASLIRSRYNACGDLTETLFFDSGGAPRRRLEFCYTEAQRLTQSFDYFGNVHLKELVPQELLAEGDYTLAFKTVYAYDVIGRIIGEEVSSCDGLLLEKTLRVYDAEGEVVEEACFRGDGSLRRKIVYRHEYDEYENWTRRITSEWKAETNSHEPKFKDERSIRYLDL